MKQIHKPWSKEEIIYLKNNYKNTSIKEISIKMNRIEGSINNMAQRLKLKRDMNGSNNPSWKRGSYMDNRGYRILTGKYDCPYSGVKGRVLEHIYVWWSNHPNDPILRREVVHHINEIKTDNRLENLKKLKRSEHHKIHGFGSYGRKK